MANGNIFKNLHARSNGSLFYLRQGYLFCFVLFFSQEENARRWRVLLILYISTYVFLRTGEN